MVVRVMFLTNTPKDGAVPSSREDDSTLVTVGTHETACTGMYLLRRGIFWREKELSLFIIFITNLNASFSKGGNNKRKEK